MRQATLLCLMLAACNQPRQGEELARVYCGACHAFPEPGLLDKKTWQAGVLPQMSLRLGVHTPSSFSNALRNPRMTVLTRPVAEGDWERIAAYYLEHAPESLPEQGLPAEPREDPAAYRVTPFASLPQSSAIITLLNADTVHDRIFAGEAGSNRLRMFDWNRRLLSTLTLASPPTDLIVEPRDVLVLESGILDPNDEARGRLVRYDLVGSTALQFGQVLIDSLIRPVFARPVDFDRDDRTDYVICEYGDNRGRLALYRFNGSGYEREVLDSGPGAIRFEVRDLTGDGHPDIVALFAQGDERITLFENDGTGHFPRARNLARFPPVYGSMHFAMHDFNGDGHLDIVYVNGDNFDYSRVLKPYHGVRILENDGHNNFRERFFFPIYGAAQAAVADFDRDGDLDIVTASNFADPTRHPERGIMLFENTGSYTFRPNAFSAAASNQWNVMATADLNRDGRLDVIIGAMSLANVARGQRFGGTAPGNARDPILLLESRP